MTGRMPFPTNRGWNRAPIQAGQPPRGSRNAHRAYNYQQRNVEQDWSEAREFEERDNRPRRQTERSRNWKDKKTNSKRPPEKKDDASVAVDFKSKDETSPIDEPMYDLGPHTTSIPVQEIYSQNIDMSGYIDQVERTYELMRGIDPRLDRRMPFSMFQHSMTSIANCYLIDVASSNGERKLGSGKMQDLLPEDLCLPDNLYHFLTNIGNTTTPNGEEVKFNLPNIAIPQNDGSFGAIDAANHNVYECYIAPIVTMNRVLNSRRPAGAPEIPPIPAALIPAGAVPTRNLLGFGPPDVLHQEARNRIEGFEFPPDGDSEVSRLKICPELMARVNTVLFEMRGRYKMRDIGRSSPGLRNYVIPKHIPGNIAYVRVETATPDNEKLSQKQNQIRSSAQFGSSSAGQNNVTCLHRERVPRARGLCFTINNAAPGGWNATINNNFEMIGPFMPTIGITNPALRLTKFISHAPAGSRVTAIDNYIKRNFYIPAR